MVRGRWLRVCARPRHFPPPRVPRALDTCLFRHRNWRKEKGLRRGDKCALPQKLTPPRPGAGLAKSPRQPLQENALQQQCLSAQAMYYPLVKTAASRDGRGAIRGWPPGECRKQKRLMVPDFGEGKETPFFLPRPAFPFSSPSDRTAPTSMTSGVQPPTPYQLAVRGSKTPMSSCPAHHTVIPQVVPGANRLYDTVSPGVAGNRQLVHHQRGFFPGVTAEGDHALHIDGVEQAAVEVQVAIAADRYRARIVRGLLNSQTRVDARAGGR